MFPPNLFFSILILFLTTAALDQAPANPNTNDPSPAHHAVERDLLLAQNPQNVTDPPLTTTTSPSTLNATNDIQFTCFAPEPHSPYIIPTDCHTALYKLLAAPDALELKRYDRTSELPIETNWQSCSVILTRSSARSDDVFQPVLIAHAAAVVTKNCVIQQFGFQGGYARIGTGVGFLVYVSASGDPRDGPSAAA